MFEFDVLAKNQVMLSQVTLNAHLNMPFLLGRRMTIHCKVCGQANTASTSFCEVCGIELAVAPDIEASSPRSTSASTESPPSVATAPATLSEEVEEKAKDEKPDNGLTPIRGVPQIPIPKIPIPKIPIPDLSAPQVSVEPKVVPDPPSDPLVDVQMKTIDAELVVAAPPPLVRPPPPASIPLTAQAPSAQAHGSNQVASVVQTGLAQLEVKRYGSATGEMIPLEGERLVVGRFDPSSGPVDIDLGHLDGQEHLSRHHAELFLDQGCWYIRDLASTNGVYIKRKAEAKFSPRLTAPVQVQDGDELAFGHLMLIFHGG